MTKTSRTVALAAASAALLFALTACAGTAAPEATTSTTPAPSDEATLTIAGACDGDEGVTVVVDAGNLADAADAAVETCVLTTEAIGAAEALELAGVVTEGTEEYGDEVVCRVNDLPSATEPLGSTEDPAYIETCESMPAAFGYWALWQKPAGGEWGYAMEGLSTLQVAPGESIELLFTLDGAPAEPSA